MRLTAWDADALHTLQASAEKSPFGPLASPAEILHGSLLYEYCNRGQHALIAVKPLAFSGGVRLDVTGLVSDGDRLDGREFADAIDAVARQHDARIMALCTSVPHVAKTCLRNGWGISGTIMLKVLDKQ